MSIETSAWAKRQRTGSPANRAVLVELANWANPDGEVQFRRISDIANACEMSERQAQRIIKKLETTVSDGGLELIKRVRVFSDKGAQKANSFRLVGYRKEGDNMSPSPRDNMSPTGATICHRGGDTHVTGGGDTDVTPYKELDLDSDITPNPHAGGRKPRFQFPDDWKAPSLADLPPAAQRAASQWPAGAYEGQAEAFVGLNRGKGLRASDWNDLWAAWIAQKHEGVMRGAKAGGGYTAPVVASADIATAQPRSVSRPAAAKSREDKRSEALHEALREVVGDMAWERWLRSAALLFTDPGLTVVTSTQHHAERLDSEFHGHIDKALSALGWGRDWVRFDVQAKGGKRAAA